MPDHDNALFINQQIGFKVIHHTTGTPSPCADSTHAVVGSELFRIQLQCSLAEVLLVVRGEIAHVKCSNCISALNDNFCRPKIALYISARICVVFASVIDQNENRNLFLSASGDEQ